MGSQADTTKAKERNPTVAGQGTCDAKTRSGGHCGKPAGWGTPFQTGRCKLHGGSTPNHVKSAQLEQARQAADRWGLPIDVGAKEALVQELRDTNGLVAFYAAQVARLTPENMHGPVGGGQGGFPKEEPNIWIVLHQAERKHKLAVAKACHDVGVDEWRMEMAEQAGQWIADAVREFCRLRGLSLDEPKTRDAVRGCLRLIEGGGGPAA